MSEHAVMPLEDYKRACDYIRYHADTTESIKSGELTEKIDALYIKANSDGIQSGYAQGHEAGYNSGFTEGEHSGIALGKQEEYDAFWDYYQDNGNRVKYGYGFAGFGWNRYTFKPKYKMVPTECAHMFQETGRKSGASIEKITPDIVDFSQVTSATSVFTNADIDYIEVDFSACKSMSTTFSAPAGTCMPTIKVKMAPTSVSDPFYRNVFLENLTFLEGSEIKCNGYSFQYCINLTKQSFINIVNVLSANTSGLTITLPLNRIKKVFETSSGANDGNTNEEWLNLIATKPNWTINLI